MKKILSIFLIGLTLQSCLKTGSRELGVYDITNGYIRYQLNNLPYEINGGYNSFLAKGVGVYGKKLVTSANLTGTRYTIFGQLSAKQAINIVIITDSLKPGSYSTGMSSDGTTYARVDSFLYTGNRVADVLNLTITRNSSGTVDGTFSGKLSSVETVRGSAVYTDAILTNGAFQNVAINY